MRARALLVREKHANPLRRPDLLRVFGVEHLTNVIRACLNSYNIFLYSILPE
jgi:hypothetical protein